MRADSAAPNGLSIRFQPRRCARPFRCVAAEPQKAKTTPSDGLLFVLGPTALAALAFEHADSEAVHRVHHRAR